MLANWAIHLPLGLVRDQLVERRYGLTSQSPGGWFGDQLKGLAVNAVIGVPMGTGAAHAIRARPRDWWLILATATVPVSVAFAQLAPIVLMPLFNRFERLQDDRLEARLRSLADRAGLPIAAVYRMDMSRQTEKPNAFFTGLGRTKRIVLSDTLLDRFDADEIDTVVAHELGHQVHNDIWRFLAVGSVAGYGLAFATNRLSPPLVRATASRTGVTDAGDVAALPLLALIASVAGLAILPITTAVSRAIEARTDRFALELTGNGDAYASALRRLATEHLADPDPSRWVVFLLYSHPPLARRIEAAETYARGRRRTEANV
jgi:STE24 endopeptidase